MGFFSSFFSSDEEDLGPPPKEVRAPRDLNRGDMFELQDNMGATWKNLKVPDTDNHEIVKKGETFGAICDPEVVIINIKAQQDAEEGHEFKAGGYPFQWIVEKAPQEIKNNQFYDIPLKSIDFKNMCVYEKKTDSVTIGKGITGVDEHITQICANMSSQIYTAGRKKHFKTLTSDGEHEAKIEVFDDHGQYNASIPAFAVGIINQTMIIAWRGTNAKGSGTNTALDFISDFAIGPTMSHLLGSASAGIRMHNAMHSFASLELEVHGDTIISLIGENKITEIVFTGHSLGGGIAQCAHLILQAQMDGLNDSSSAQKWTQLGYITLRTIVFSAPQSILGKGLVLSKGKRVHNKESEDLLEKIGGTTMNFVYGSDIVPRGYSHLHYIGEVLDKVAEESPETVGSIAPPLIRMFSSFGFVRESLQDIIGGASKDVSGVFKDFRHHGKLVYYQDTTAMSGGKPKVLTHDEFDKITYASLCVSNTKTGIDRLENIANDHSYPRDSFVSYEATPVVDEKEAMKIEYESLRKRKRRE